MFLKSFPDIHWIRKQAQQGFVAGRDIHGNKLPTTGWPTVVMNVKSSGTERDHIKGPFSLFYNLKGHSMLGLERDWYRVGNGFFGISNDRQSYNLHIPESSDCTTFNIHFGKTLFSEVQQVAAHTHNWALDNIDDPNHHSVELLPCTYFMSDELHQKIINLHCLQQDQLGAIASDKEYELTASILEYLLVQSRQELKKQDLISAQKASTRQELFHRVGIARDFIHAHHSKTVTLDDLSRNAGLSKFHLIRVFKEVTGLSPVDYIRQIKGQRARRLLLETQKDLSLIALDLGFSELSAFTRFFKRQSGLSPSLFRQTN